MKLKHVIVLLFCLALTSKVNAVNLFTQERNTALVSDVQVAKYLNKNPPELICERKTSPVSEQNIVSEKNIKLAILANNDKKETLIEKNQTDKNNQKPIDQKTTEQQMTVLIKKIDVEGYEILTDKEISTVTSKFEGKYLTLEEIKKIPDEINDIYRNYKILTVIAYLPPQDIIDNTVKIKVLEGRIGKIRVVGNKKTNSTYIKHVLNQKEGDIIFVPEIEQKIISFNKNSDVRLSASIKKGEKLGTTDIELNLKENNPYHFGLSFDNSGTDNTGLYQTGINTQIDSLLGFRDKLMSGFQVSKGINSIYSGYEIPLGYSGLKLGGIFSKGNSSVIEGAFKDSDIKAKSTNYSVYLSRPVYNSRKLYIGSNASLNFKTSKTYMLGVPIEELGGDPTSRITSTKLSLISILNDKYGQWTHSSNVHLGMTALGGKEEFYKYTGSIQRTTLLGKNSMLILKGSTQLTSRQLPPLEKFQVGGVDTVHGYPESYSVGDCGYVLNSEFRYPLAFLPKKIGKYEFRKRFQGIIFMDMGRNYYKDKVASSEIIKLMGVGGGIRFKISKYLSGRIDYSYGLTHRNDSINLSRINFQIDSNPN